MYAIRNKKTGLWHWRRWSTKCTRKLDTDSLFRTKALAKSAIRTCKLDPRLFEIVPVEIVEKKE